MITIMAYTKTKRKTKTSYSKKAPVKKKSQRTLDNEGMDWAGRRLFGQPAIGAASRGASTALKRRAAQYLQDEVIPRVAHIGKEKLDAALEAGGAQLHSSATQMLQKVLNPTSDASQGVGEEDPTKKWLGETKPTQVTPELERGFMYSKEFIVRANKRSKIFERNKELYARTKHMYFDMYNQELSYQRSGNSLRSFNWPALYSQTGYNRRGWYGPTSTFTAKGAYGMINSPLLPIDTFLTGSLQRWGFVREHLCSAATDSYMQNQAAYSTNNLRDLSFLLSKSIDTMTVFSRNADIGVNVTAHILRCRKSTMDNPHLMLSSFDTSSPNFLKCPNNFVYDRSPSQGPGSRPLPVYDRGSSFMSAGTWAETSTSVGVSYSLSPMLKEHWEVVEVMKQKLMPSDKWEIKVVQEYSDVFSYRAMQSLNPYLPDPDTIDPGPAIDTYTGNRYNTGDLAMLFTFTGDPGNGVYRSSDQPGAEVANQSWKQLPSRISIMSNSSIEYHCQEDFDPDTGARTTALQQSLVREAENAAEVYSAQYGDEKHTVMVASKYEYTERVTKVETI